MNIRETLQSNGIETENLNISNKILEMDNQGCNCVRELGTSIFDLYDGFELSDKEGNISIRINIECDSEFVPLAIFTFDGENDVENGYNNDAEKVYVVEDGVYKQLVDIIN